MEVFNSISCDGGGTGGMFQAIFSQTTNVIDMKLGSPKTYHEINVLDMAENHEMSLFFTGVSPYEEYLYLSCLTKYPISSGTLLFLNGNRFLSSILYL